jgi:hypothetical protein
MKFKRLLAMVTFISLFGILNGRGAALSTAPEPRFDFKLLNGLSRDQLLTALDGIADSRNQEETEVLIELRRPSDGIHPKLAAIYISGLYRMEKAAPDLATMIDQRQDKQRNEDDGLTIWGGYPAADALVMIGNRAVPSLLHNLAVSDNQEVRRLSAGALTSILGANPAKATVRDAMTAPAYGTDGAMRNRLAAALNLVE